MEQAIYLLIIVLVVVLQLFACVFLLRKENSIVPKCCSWTSAVVLVAYFVLLWILEQHPPMKTVWETRFLFALCATVVGSVSCTIGGCKSITLYGFILSTVFLLLNFFKYETVETQLPLALQSIWFVPHVVVYMFGYAFLGIAALLGLKREQEHSLKTIDNLISLGFICLSLGLIMGSLWAKNIWGGYWTWDPKELWAFVSWLLYLLYLHVRYAQKENVALAKTLAVVSFLVVLFCWLGLNFLLTPENSVHVGIKN